jgi:hypothetical protein
MRKRFMGLLAVALCLPMLALTGGSRADATTENWPDVFDPLVLRTLSIQMSAQDWDFIRKDLTETYRPGWLSADGETPMYVAVRRKSSRALPSESNPIKVGIKIDINEYVDGQTWHGLSKLSLENGTDSGVLEEGLAWAMHRMAGAPLNGYAAAYANWVGVHVNDQYIGLYVNAEQRDKQALRQRGIWAGGSTWLYEQTTEGALLEEGDPNSPALGHLCFSPFRTKSERPCKTPSDAVLASDLPAWIDMDAFLGYCAVDALADNKDGLCSHNNNAFFVDFSEVRMAEGARRVYMPWDLDTVFQQTTGNIYGLRSNRRLVQSAYEMVILGHPQFRAQYNAQILALTDPAGGPLSVAAMHAFVDQLQAVLGPALAAEPYPSGESFGGDLSGLKAWLSSRIANARAQAIANTNPAPRS